MSGRVHLTGLSNEKYACRERYLPRIKRLGRARTYLYREILDACFCVVVAAATHESAPWKSVYHTTSASGC